MALVCKPFGDIITFTRTSGATWFNSAGVNVGIDFSTSSVAIGTGSKTFTLTADAGVDRSWATGDIVRISEQATPANFMDGTVTSYTASTQTLVVNVTATGGSGTIASWRVSNWMPRLDFNPATLAAQGLLIEEQRTNLCLQSEDLATTWSITGTASVSTNVASSPAATTTADKFILGNTITSGNAALVQVFSKAATATTYTASIFVKAAEFNSLRFVLRDGAVAGNNVEAYFNANTGTIASTATAAGTFTAPSATISNIGSGWYRVTLTGTTSTETTLNIRALVYQNGTGTATGNGTDGILLWGAQLEAGAFPTSYIPTTTTALTRSADVASVNTLSPWFNSTTGTIYAEFLRNTTPAASTFPQFVNIDDGSINNRLALLTNSSRSLSAQVAIGGVFTSLTTGQTWAEGTASKLALAYQALNHAASANGSSPVTNTAVNVPSGLTTMRLGDQAGGGGNLNGWLRRVSYFPRRLANAELQSLTS